MVKANKKLIFAAVVVVLIIFILRFEQIMRPFIFYRSHGHFFGQKPYEYYSRPAFTERMYGHQKYNMSRCKYPHFPLARPRADGSVNWDTGAYPKVEVAYATPLRIHIYRSRFHTTMHFEWLWNSILHNDGEDLSRGEEHRKGKTSPRSKTLRKDNIQLIHVSNVKDLKAIADRGELQTLFVVSASYFLEDLAREFFAHSIPVVPMGTLVTHAESCMATDPAKLPLVDPSTPNTRYGKAARSPADYLYEYVFLTYGDCDLVDNERVRLWPLGPDTNILAMLDDGTMPEILPMVERKLDINMVGSLRSTKPTRPQAMFAMSDVCSSGRSCREITGLTPYAILGSLGDSLGVGDAIQVWGAQHIPNEYRSIMFQSRLTLSPAGTAPECGRTLEAIMAGSVPVIEEWFEEGVSPNHGANFKCMAADNNAFFREGRAPALWVVDWRRDLPRVVAILDRPAQLQQMQDNMAVWYAGLVAHLRRLWVGQAHLYLRTS
jgi:hypothetical protein